MTNTVGNVVERTQRVMAANQKRCRQAYEALLKRLVTDPRCDVSDVPSILASVGRSPAELQRDCEMLAGRLDAIRILAGEDPEIIDANQKLAVETEKVESINREMTELMPAMERFRVLESQIHRAELERRFRVSIVSDVKARAEDFLRRTGNDRMPPNVEDAFDMRVWDQRPNQPRKFR